MRKELCFRVETEDGVGMYRCSFCTLMREIDDHRTHPMPSDDSALEWFSLRDKDAYYFGFSSLEQLRRWIFREDYIASMREHNVAVSIYETDDYRIGDTQMVFRKSTARRIGRFHL